MKNGSKEWVMMPDRIKAPDVFWQSIEQKGIRLSELLREANLPLTVAKRDGVMTTAQLFDFWRALEKLGGPDFAHDLCSDLNGATLPPAMHVAFHAKNLGEGLHRVSRFKALTAPELIQIANHGDDCVITTSWLYSKDPEPHGITDASFAFLVNMARTCTELDVKPKYMELKRQRSEKLEAWFGCAIKWGSSRSRLVFKRSDLDLPFVEYNRELLEMLDEALEQKLAQLGKDCGSFTDQVRWHLHRCLTAGRPKLHHIAHELAISERSLQRRLQQEGYSFQSLLGETRRQLARHYLKKADFEISEISFLLGFEDQGSFYRAFQKWENQTPAAWRQAQAVPH